MNSHLLALYQGTIPSLAVDREGCFSLSPPLPGLLLPGSFDPLHEGHLQLARLAGQRTGLDPAFELTIVNADKPPIAEAVVRRRLEAFARERATVWLTRASTFVEKARLFPGVVFVVGADTAARIVEPRFYGDSKPRLHLALDEVRDRKCRFLVAGRLVGTEFLALEDLAIPPGFADLFEAIPAEAFRNDVSSTALRARS